VRVTSTQTCLIIIILGDFEFSKMFEESRLRYVRRLVGEGFEGGEGSRGSCLLVFQLALDMRSRDQLLDVWRQRGSNLELIL